MMAGQFGKKLVFGGYVGPGIGWPPPPASKVVMHACKCYSDYTVITPVQSIATGIELAS